jgi:hypothetical protein
MTVNLFARLDISSSATDLGTPTTADFTAGGKIAPQDGPTLTVHSNESYAVAVTANTPTFGFVPIGTTPNPNKQASDLTWAKVAAAAACPSTPASYGNNMGTAANLITGATGAPAIGANAPSEKICYRTLWTSTATAGSYSMVVNFTLSEP